MRWELCAENDCANLLRLTLEPMGGKVKLAWGLKRLTCPPECTHLRAYSMKVDEQVVGCAMAWDWPEGQRYLSGLRFGKEMAVRPRPKFWKTAFESLLDGVNHAWTSIGQDNQRARRILESGVAWLPKYTPRQTITTWFVPFSRAQSKAVPRSDTNGASDITALDWRHIAITSGVGCSYRIGRLIHQLGMPGVPKPNQALRIGGYAPKHVDTLLSIRKTLTEARGYDGLVIVLPDNSEISKLWIQACPKLAWKWTSTLYSVSWNTQLDLPSIPDWKGHWL